MDTATFISDLYPTFLALINIWLFVGSIVIVCSGILYIACGVFKLVEGRRELITVGTLCMLSGIGIFLLFTGYPRLGMDLFVAAMLMFFAAPFLLLTFAAWWKQRKKGK
jgi:hypothetical protein